MIRFSQFTLARAGKPLIEKADITLFPGERIGLVGDNGAGKSTLLAAILGELLPESGDLNLPSSWRIAHVAQETPALPISALQFVLDGDDELQRLQQQLDHAERTENYDILGELHAAIADIDGYAAPARASTLLTGLGFSNEGIQRPVSSFSGGWRMRLNLARALGSRAEVLLLDEPTNHLDIEAVLWVEEWLVKARCTMIIVSHDREFLDTVATHVISLSNRTLTKYSGGYSQYEQQYGEHQRQTNIAAGKQAVEAERLQRFVDRFRAQATKAKQAQSRLKRLAKMQMIATFRPPLPFDFSFPQPDKMPDPLVTLLNAACGYSVDKPILNKITLEIRPGQRIGLLGQNGNGKSTLIKSLVGDLPLLQGERLLGKGAVIGYFAQHQVDTLHLDDTALSHFKRLAPREREQTLRNFLGRFGFAGEKVEQLIETYSGGEKARLALCCMIWLKPNLLLLDEPTNHLDLQCREALAEALIEFGGALVVVSHDRHLLESTTDQYMRIHAGAVTPFDGDLDDYNSLVQSERNAANNASKTLSAAKTKTTPVDVSKPLAAIPHQLLEKKKQISKQLQQIENTIQQLQTQLTNMNTAMHQQDAFSVSNLAQTSAMTKEHQALTTQLLKQEELWLSLQSALEEIDSLQNF